ncbi:hypothetical protein FACS189440_21140 [Bacteroidia bacterium]|nr:hypothetical protein FACS189440_21140 [Bacteroidia bacterium]
MQKLTLIFSIIIITLLSPIRSNANNLPLSGIRQLYENLHLQDKVCYNAFQQAVAGYNKMNVKNPVLTIIDFSKASTEERMYVIDMEKKILLFRSHVAHGKNSGANYATSFSNKPGSYQSSLGFYLTEKTYQGKNGLSLVLNGLEKGINDNAKSRAVVIHGADYCNPKSAKSLGRLGRSFGCPALPKELTKPIIDTIKNGSLLYIYSESYNNTYLKESSILN